MPVAAIDGAEIHYEVIGEHGPWMTAIPGGRHPLSEVRDLARGLADHGFPYYDQMHPWAVARHAHQAIPGSRLIDFDPARHDERVMSPVDIARDAATVARTLWTLLGAA